MNSFSSIVTVSNFKTAGRAMLVLALFMMSVFASSYSFAGRATGTPIRKEASSAAATSPATVAAAAPVKKNAAASTTPKPATPTRKAKAVTTSAAAPAAAVAAPATATAPTLAAASTSAPYPPYYGQKSAEVDARERYDNNCRGKSDEIKNSPDCQTLYQEAYPRSGDQCQKSAEKIEEAGRKAKEACGKAGLGTGDFIRCFDTINACNKAEDDIATESDDDEKGSSGEFCNRALANRCPAIPTFMEGRDYREEEKTAEEKRKDAKREVDDLLDDQQKLQSEQIKMKQEMQEELQNAARSRIRKSQEILDRAKSDKENLSESTRKAMDDARSVYNQMDAKYIELRDKARRATSNVRRTQDQLQATCRAAASANYTKAEAARLAAQKQGKRNVGSATGMAGGAKRKAAKDVRARNADYVAFFNECVGGVSPEGRSALNAINKAADDLKDEEQLIADQSALIEKQRLDVLQKLKEMEASVPQKEQKIIEAMNQELKNLDDDYNLAVQQANQKANSLQQEMSGKLMSIQNKLNSAQQEMQKSSSASLLAKRRSDCLGRAGNRSETVRDKIAEGFQDGIGQIDAVYSMCDQFPKSCTPRPAVCALANDTRTKKRKPVEFDINQ
ncbi:MAG: hypothetical protein IPJ84_02630 [Bdellovibrionales bacterium]|nr:hypothetical protein [Bdellovibrionales bacterium]